MDTISYLNKMLNNDEFVNELLNVINNRMEKDMSKKIDVTSLIVLADIGINNALSEFGMKIGINNDDEFSNAIIELQKNKRKEAILNAAEAAVALDKDAENMILEAIADLRKTRRIEKQIISKIKSIKRARDYGMETKNFMPLFSLITLIPYEILNNINKELLVVPDDWKPKTPEVEKTPATKAAVKKQNVKPVNK